MYKAPPPLAVPDINEDAAERKRVLNVLAQRRYSKIFPPPLLLFPRQPEVSRKCHGKLKPDLLRRGAQEAEEEGRHVRVHRRWWRSGQGVARALRRHVGV